MHQNNSNQQVVSWSRSLFPAAFLDVVAGLTCGVLARDIHFNDCILHLRQKKKKKKNWTNSRTGQDRTEKRGTKTFKMAQVSTLDLFLS